MRFSLYLGVWIFSLSFSNELIGQIHIQGIVSDEHGEALEGAHIRSDSLVAITNEKGAFQLDQGDVGVIEISHINYDTEYITISKSQMIEIRLKTRSKTLDVLQIEAVSSQEMKKVAAIQITHLNSLFGENDILKYLVTLPGVSSINSFDAGISVRGGSTVENAFLIDGIRIAEPKHITMLVTAFDSYVLSQSEVYRSGYPSIYNGKLSGYVDMMGVPDDEKGITGEATLGIISSSVKTSIVLGEKVNHNIKFSGRYSYLGLISKMYERVKKLDEIPNYQLGDFTLSYHGTLSDKWSLTTYFLASLDDLPLILNVKNGYQMNWENQSTLVSLNRVLNKNGMLTLQLGGNRSRAQYQNMGLDQLINSTSDNQTALLKIDQPISDKLTLAIGYKSEWSEYQIVNGEDDANRSTMDNHMQSLFGDVIFFSKEFLTITGGANLTYYNGEVSLLDLSPRFKMHFLLDRSEVWLDYARTQQYEEKLPFFTIRSPIDIPVPLGHDNQSAQSDQVSIGASRQLLRSINLTSSVFYKQLSHIKEFSTVSRSNLDFESIQMIEGKGYAYGIETELACSTAKFDGRINYTYLNSKRQFDQINQGESFSPPFDITSNATISLFYQFNQNWSLSALWTYSSGIYVTIPEGVTVAKDITNPSSIVNYIPIYGDRYNYRLPARHRLDLTVNYYQELKGRCALKISAGTYNTYNRQNADFIYFEVEQKDEFFVSFVPKSKMVLPFVPYLSVTVYLNHKGPRYD